jgi:hypothetical protein
MHPSILETLIVSTDVDVSVACACVKFATWYIPDDRYVLSTQSMTLG